jgi:8-oxo-dGTP pyrophosphatase MutT (NUDIX family)
VCCAPRRATNSTKRRTAAAAITTSRADLLEELRAYAPADAREAAMRERVVAFVGAHRDAFVRSLLIGHVTASAWIIDPGRTRTLLTHHRKLGKWLQLGGHVDGDPDVRHGALREATEESGLTSLRFASEAIYDLDVHPIPARGGEPAHEHFDIRFALEADPGEPLTVSAESKELAWVRLEALAGYGVDESVLRLARKTAMLASS